VARQAASNMQLTHKMPGQEENGQDNTSYYYQGRKQKQKRKKVIIKPTTAKSRRTMGIGAGQTLSQTVIDDEEKRSIILCERISITSHDKM